MNYLDQIDFCIKTYKRPKAFQNLFDSIRLWYPEAQICVNDHPELHTGRNELVRSTLRPFLLFLDDDFLFTEETDIGWLYEELRENPDIGVAGGVVMDRGNEGRVQRQSGGLLVLKDGSLSLTSRLRGVLASKWCDITPNFCLIRREVFDKCQWRWGVGAEHADFFLQVRDAGWRVCQIDDVTIDHDLNAPALPCYKAARWNVAENILRFMNHWGIDRVVVNGKVVHSRPVGLEVANARAL